LPAFATALRLILKAFFSVKLLVANGENEWPAAFFAGNALVFQG